MKTIVISRLIGSGAVNIARRVTEALGYTLVNRSVLEGIFRQDGLTKVGELCVCSKYLGSGKLEESAHRFDVK